MKTLPNGLKNGKWVFVFVIMPLIIAASIILENYLVALWQVLYGAAVFMWYRSVDQHRETLGDYLAFLTRLNGLHDELLQKDTPEED